MAKALEYKVGDYVVYPGYGVVRIRSIETKEIMGCKQTFFIFETADKREKLMVPDTKINSVGLRPIISSGEADRVLGILKEKDVKIDNQTWNRRYREYIEKIKTGSVYEIAEVLRDLYVLKVEKDLSFGERKMLKTARDLLLKELSMAKTTDELKSEEGVAAIFEI